MADEANAPVSVDSAKAVEESTRPTDHPAEPAVAGAKSADGGDVATTGDAAEDSTSGASKQDPPADETTAPDANTDSATAGDDTATALPAGAAEANGTPASKKAANNNRRKSGASVPEHKKKTPNKKKKAPSELHLNVQPGETWFVAMRGYQPWPVIICDEEMLPESLLSKRPVSAKRIDGTYREDFMEGGKNAKDRRYPIMFLGTNEFSWHVNTELQPFDLDEVVKEVNAGNTTKKSKALWAAYEVAAKNHDLAYFKDMLKKHEAALAEETTKLEQDDEPEEQEKKKTTKRKSTAAEESDDVEMEDAVDDGAASAKKAKPSKKRKKDAESDAEPDKPAKTPKTKLKLNNKAPKDAPATKPKKESKAKKAKAKSESEEAEPVPVEEKPLTEAERLEKREKSVLYLRHRLQKGFLSRDQAPKEEEMDNMSDYLKQLEAHQDLEAEVIKKTKVHKVLKAIIKLNFIPKEEEFSFKKRSTELLNKWNSSLAAETEPAGEASASVEPTTNGVKHDEEKKTDTTTSSTDRPEHTSAKPEAAKTTDGDGDVSMADAKDETSAKVDAATDTAAA